MTSFDNREADFENKYVLDEVVKFKATARRNNLLGLWAAEKMGLAEKAAEDYGQEMVKIGSASDGDENVFNKIRHDFDNKGVDQSDHRIHRTMAELMASAVDQLKQVG